MALLLCLQIADQSISCWSARAEQPQISEITESRKTESENKRTQKQPNACQLSPEVVWEDFLSYREHCARLKTLIAPVSPHREGMFDVQVDESGVARLKPVYSPPKAENTNEDAGFTKAPGCYMPDGKWSRLTLSTTKELFGSPRKHRIYGSEIYIFDARGTWGDEENIYHIDLVFDSEEVVSAYRVRGIGISKPLWIKNGKTSNIP